MSVTSRREEEIRLATRADVPLNVEAAMTGYRLVFEDITYAQNDDHVPKKEDWEKGDAEAETQLRVRVASCFHFSPSRIVIDKWDGEFIYFTASFCFEADGFAAVRRETRRIVDTCGWDLPCFSVVDEADSIVLTEEEL